MQYRSEIDGLRAVAVIPVILFHAGINAFSGGYVGVDIFFVISGYLITSIILSEISNQNFSLISFYERRARRILPALFFVMFFCLPFAWFWLMPHELKGFSQSLVAVTSFSSNIYFWMTTGYFETAAELRPLLHTWSLAVEEQYYLVFPIFLVLGMRWGRNKVIPILIFIAGLSLFSAQFMLATRPALTFYLLPTRIWELLLGGLIAFYPQISSQDKRLGLMGELGSMVGLALICYAIFGFNKFTPFPGVNALIPVFGAMLIIIYANQETTVGRLLSTRPLVGLGLISYSLYLWHQPIFAFARIKLIDEPNQYLLIALSFLAAFFAYISWKFVETPFRNKRLFNRKKICSLSILATVFFISFGLIGQFTSGFLTKSQKAVLAYNEYQNQSKAIGRVGTCFLDVGEPLDLFNASCIANGDKDSVFIWGDSHAAALSYGLRQVFENVTQFTSTGCPPLIGKNVESRPLCKKINDYIAAQVKIIKPKRIFLYANWVIYGDQSPIENLTKTIDFIRMTSPLSKITILGGTPQFKPSLPTYMFLNHKNLEEGEFLPTYLYNDIAYWDHKFSVLAKEKGVDFISPLNLLCKADNCQITTFYDGQVMPIIWDYGHLTAGGSVLVAEKIKSRIESFLAGN